MFKKWPFIDFVLVLALSSFVFLFRISGGDAGLWEPWETSAMLAARQMSQSSIVESIFWVPQLEGELIAQPYLQLWSLATVLHAFTDPDAFLLRLPSACIGILLTILFFITIRQASSRRAAWVSTGILLTMPMFVFGGKLVHGDIWLIFAVAIPWLFFILTSYASTRRMQRVMASFTGISLFLSFLSGGLFALAIIACTALILVFLMRKHPHRKSLFWPYKTHFFLFPLYISFILSATIFGNYVTHARYALEHRTPITLTELNKSLDEDRVISIERRQNQIIGTYHLSGTPATDAIPFVLVESAENLSTNATMIFNLNETDQRTFENFLMWRFQKRVPPKANLDVPPIDGAVPAALRFFWYYTCSHTHSKPVKLGRIQETSPWFSPDRIPADNGNTAQTLGTLSANELVQILDTSNPFWTKIETGSGKSGYMSSSAVSAINQSTQIPWKWWFDTLIYGLIPWIIFFPIAFICARSAVQKLMIPASVFMGEYVFHPNEDVSKQPSPLQHILLSWLLVSVLALIPSYNQSFHGIFVGILPIAALLGISVTSPIFWRAIRQNLEVRLLWIIIAILCLIAALYGIDGVPFRPIKYMLTDPMMHWNNLGVQIDGKYILYFVIAVIMIFISFTGMADLIQNKFNEWKEQRKPAPQESPNLSSSTTLTKVTRTDIEPMPIAPVFALLFMGIISASFLYFIYFPKVSDEFTETALINRYFELADQSEPIYLLSGENAQLCQSYKDCDPGYVCQNAHCHISTFSSYSLNIAHQIHKDDMLNMLSQKDNAFPAFYIIPKDTLYAMNQAYRFLQTDSDRQNLTVLDAPSSRLYLIGNHKDVESVNPFNHILISELPQDATKLSLKLSDSIQLEGFRIDRLDFVYAKVLRMTLYYRVIQPITTPTEFEFAMELKGRKKQYQRSLVGSNDERLLLPDDLVADEIHFEDNMMPSHGSLDLQIGVRSDESAVSMKPLTTIEF